MATEKELLQIEQDAQKLRDDLKQLHSVVGSYNQAKVSLEDTNKRLAEFIDQTQQLAQETHHLISVAKEIGSAKLLEKLFSIEQNNKRRFIFTIVAIGLTLLFTVINLAIK